MIGTATGAAFLIPENIGNYIAIFTGLVWKFYDDYVDLGLSIRPAIIEFLKLTVALSTTLLLGLNTYLAIIFAALTAFVFIEGVAETPFWKAGAIIPLIMLALGLPYFSYNSIGEVIYFFGALVVCSATLFAEHKFFPEEISWKKAAVRILTAGFTFIFPYMFPQYSYSRAFLLIAFWNLGYTTAWLGVHAYQALSSTTADSE